MARSQHHELLETTEVEVYDPHMKVRYGAVKSFCSCDWESAPFDPIDFDNGDEQHPYDKAQQAANDAWEQHRLRTLGFYYQTPR